MQHDDWTRAVVRVTDGGRGFVIQEKRNQEERFIITGCLPHWPEANAALHDYERLYLNLIGPLDGKPTVAALCVFLDPIADIAVLSAPDDHPGPFGALVNPMQPLPVASLDYNDGLFPAESDAFLLSLDRTWFSCRAQSHGRALWIEDAVEPIRGGMSGSPIVSLRGEAIGVVCVGHWRSVGDVGPNPELAAHLPVWLWRALTEARSDRLQQQQMATSHKTNYRPCCCFRACSWAFATGAGRRTVDLGQCWNGARYPQWLAQSGGKTLGNDNRNRANSMMPSDYYLDTFVAHKISSLTECGAPELTGESRWLNSYILNSSMMSELRGERRAYAFNLIRLTEGAFSTYRDARLAIMEYVNTPRNAISPYFRALLYFEVCLSQFWQGSELIRAAHEKSTGKKLDLFKDNPVMLKIYRIYNDFKHMESCMGQIPQDATSAVWVTNMGLESVTCPSGLSFTELFDELTARGELVAKLSQLERGSP